MNNFLEQLAAEWYEYQGYFVRRNVRVGQRASGGFAGELDVVAFHPGQMRLIHIEASTDAESWKSREAKFGKKFMTGREYVRDVFPGFELPELEQMALLGYASAKSHPPLLGGGKVVAICEFLEEIKAGIPNSTEHLIHEQFVILRTLQFAKECWTQPTAIAKRAVASHSSVQLGRGSPMTISWSRPYIESNPRFALIGDSPLQSGQETMVHKAFAPNPKLRSLEELAESCLAQDYEQTYKRPILASDRWLFLRRSILYHLKRMEKKGIIREL